MSINDITKNADLSKENLFIKIEFIGNVYFEETIIVENVPVLIEFDELGRLKILICSNKVIPLNYDTCKNIEKPYLKLCEEDIYEQTMYCTCEKITSTKHIDFNTNNFFYYNIKGYDDEYEYIVNDVIFNGYQAYYDFYVYFICHKYSGSIKKECMIQKKGNHNIDNVICDCFNEKKFPVCFNINGVNLTEFSSNKILDTTFTHEFMVTSDVLYKNIENIITFLTGYKFNISIKRYFAKNEIIKYVIKSNPKENIPYTYFVLYKENVNEINNLINNSNFINSLQKDFFTLTIYYLTFLTQVNELNIKWAILLMSFEFFLNNVLIENGKTQNDLLRKNFMKKLEMLDAYIKIPAQYYTDDIIRNSYRNSLFHEGSIDMTLEHDSVFASFNEYRDLLYQLIMKYIKYDGEFILASKRFTLGKLF